MFSSAHPGRTSCVVSAVETSLTAEQGMTSCAVIPGATRSAAVEAMTRCTPDGATTTLSAEAGAKTVEVAFRLNANGE